MHTYTPEPRYNTYFCPFLWFSLNTWYVRGVIRHQLFRMQKVCSFHRLPWYWENWACKMCFVIYCTLCLRVLILSKNAESKPDASRRHSFLGRHGHDIAHVSTAIPWCICEYARGQGLLPTQINRANHVDALWCDMHTRKLILTKLAVCPICKILSRKKTEK